MTQGPQSYVEHVAIRVRDIDWHLRFFEAVFGMKLRQETDGADGKPRQAWTLGGIQLVSQPDFANPEGRLAHIGVMTVNQEAALVAARAWGAKDMAQGPQFLALPDGLVVEVLQAAAGSVAAVLNVDPRA